MKVCSRTSTWWVFFDLLSCYSHIALNVSIMSTIFDVSIKEKRVYGS